MNKKNNNQKFETVDIPEGTILESFKEYIKEHNREDDIIKFLSVKSAWLMTRIAMSDMRGEDDLPEKEKEEIKDFYEFFINNFYSKYEKAIYRNWNDDPLILRAGYVYMEEMHEKIRKSVLDSVPNNDQRMKDAKDLCDKIMSIRKNKQLSAVFGKEPERETILIPPTIKKSELDEYKEDVLYLCLRLILEGGVIVCRISEKDSLYKIFAVETDYENHTWKPTDAETLRWSMNPKTGNPPEGLKEEYIAIQKEPGEIINFSEAKKKR